MLNIYSPISSLGYGVHGINMIKAFINNNIEINLTPIGQTFLDSYYNKYMQVAINNKFDKNKPSIQIYHSSYANQFTGSPMISFCVFETTKLLPQEEYHLKNTVDMIFTTTEEHKKIIENHGITKPIYVIHEGVDSDLYNTEPCTKYIDTDKFTFITAGKHEERKNTDLIISSFIKVMQYKKCALIAHTFDPFYQGKGLPWTDLNIESLGLKGVEENNTYLKYSNGFCDIYFTKPRISVTSMRSLYRSANVGIYYSRAEGWNLSLIESMACGIPCIASNVIGHKEYLKNSPQIQQELIVEPIGMEIANDNKWFKGDRGEWAKMSKKHLYEAIEDIYDNSSKYITPNRDLSLYYHNNFNWDQPINTISNILE